MKQFLYGCILSILFIFFGQLSVAKNNIYIVATINQASVTNMDINFYTRLFLMNAGQKPTPENIQRAQQNQQMLRFSIIEKLQSQAAEKYHITLVKDDLDRAVQSYLKKNHLNRKELIKKLKTYGLPENFFITFLQEQIKWQKFVGLSAKANLFVSNFEIQEKLSELKKTLNSPLKHLYVINIPVTSLSNIPQIKQEVAQIYSQLKSGTSFIQLSKKYATSNQKYDLGFVHLQNLPPQIANLLINLKVGKYSSPIRTAMGVSIFYVDGVKKPENVKIPTKQQVRGLILNKRIETYSQRTLDQLWQQSYINISNEKDAVKKGTLNKN